MQILIKKIGKVVEIDFASLPQTTKDYILQYGMKQCLNDSIAGAKSQDECEAFLAKRIDRLVRGTVVEDKFTSICRALAIARVKMKISKKDNPAEFDSWVKKLMDHPKIQAFARQRIADELELDADFTL